MDKADMLDHLKQHLPLETLLDEIFVHSLSTDEARACYEWIARMWDIPTEDEDEQEEEDEPASP